MERKIEKLLSGPIVVIAIGLAQFAKSLEDQGAATIQVDWTPPAGGDREMMDLLDQLM